VKRKRGVKFNDQGSKTMEVVSSLYETVHHPRNALDWQNLHSRIEIHPAHGFKVVMDRVEDGSVYLKVVRLPHPLEDGDPNA
jgi:hypothetical protein